MSYNNNNSEANQSGNYQDPYFLQQKQQTVTIEHQPVQQQAEQPSGPDWDYLKTASCILRIILIILLMVSCIMMGRASLLKLLIEFSGSSLLVIVQYTKTLDLLRTLFLTATGILLSIQAIKIGLNVANFGDYKPPRNGTARGINIAINVIEGLLHFALIGITGYFSVIGIFLFLDTDFGVAMGLVIPCEIFRAVIGCVECCCKPRSAIIPNNQPIIIMRTN